MVNLNEFLTRKLRIDVFLKEQGWNIKDSSMIRVEIDTKQSDFKSKDYKEASETLKNDLESKYADYLLLDSKGEPLAVIEAKRTSKDPLVGKKQAEEYAEDILRQTGKPVFIFLSNGDEIWFWNWNHPNPFDRMRLIKGFYSRDNLERLRYQNNNKKDFSQLKIDKDIINRDYQIEAVNRVLDGINKGKRKFLLVQATGTGKTRVSMALIKMLMQSNRAERVLFLADRKALRDQAFNDGFKVFFPNESREKIFSASVDKTKRLYASTIQTFMECYQQFSPGDFDLIISDEAHRSIYNKWKDVFTYFDAIQVGLTATPCGLVGRDTFRFFECEEGKPTYLYEFDDAVEKGWLVPFRVHSSQTHFQIEGVRPVDVPDAIKDELAEKGVSEEEINFEGTDIERKVIIKGTNEAIVKEFYDNCIFDKSGTLPAKTIFFAVSKQHAKRLWEAFNDLYPEYKSKLAVIITSDDSRAQQLVKDFKTESFPRIAISVDMLDTGVDVPEVCNLVFAKPVFSKIKFWQMIGRGTRNDETCKHRDWLPAGKKENFLIFDCWNNFDWFNIHPKGKEPSQSIALPSRIFLLRINQYRLLKDKKEGAEVFERIQNDITSLPKETVSIKEKRREIETALSEKLWKNIGLDGFDFLKTQITPLMRFKQDVNLDIESFVLKVERLGLAIVEKNGEEIERLSQDIVEDVNCLPRSINEVKKKSELLDKICEAPFWKNINYEDYLLLLKDISPLMRYKRPEPIPKIMLDIGDVVQQRKLIEYGPASNPQQEYVKVYKDKIEKRIQILAKKHPTIKKIINNEEITEKDIQKLEDTLNSPELYITEDTLRKTYGQSKGTLPKFIKAILGLYKFPEPQKIIGEAFNTYMIERSDLNADQIRFLITLKNVFIQKKHIEVADFYEAPFTNIGKAPKPLFNDDELREIVAICSRLEKEI
jgi:type I restriction enzyme R subunit